MPSVFDMPARCPPDRCAARYMQQQMLKTSMRGVQAQKGGVKAEAAAYTEARARAAHVRASIAAMVWL